MMCMSALHARFRQFQIHFYVALRYIDVILDIGDAGRFSAPVITFPRIGRGLLTSSSRVLSYGCYSLSSKSPRSRVLP